MCLPDGQKRGANARAGVRVRARELACERRDFGIRLLDGHARFRPRQLEKVAGMAIAEHPIRHGVELRRHHEGNPGLEGQPGQGAAKLGRGYADDGQLLAVDPYPAADHAGVGAEAPLPQAVADDGYGIAALLVAEFLGREESAGGRLYAQYGKIVSRYEFAPDALR